MTRLPTPPPLSPYTTLFRSCLPKRLEFHYASAANEKPRRGKRRSECHPLVEDSADDNSHESAEDMVDRKSTSELQSRRDLVCRLLLEKKNRIVRGWGLGMLC